MATISKKSSLTTVMFFTMILGFVFVMSNSCQNETGKGEWIPTPPDTSSLGKIDHFISLREMNVFMTQFKQDSLSTKFPGLFIPDSESFNKEWLLKLLKDPKCVGIKIYYGVREKGHEMRLMIVGVDEQGKDLYIQRGSKLANQSGIDDEENGGLEWGQCTPPCQGRP